MSNPTQTQNARDGALYLKLILQGHIHAACAVAVEYPALDLLDLTPERDLPELIEIIWLWHRYSDIDCQSALDRLSGHYSICVACGEFTKRNENTCHGTYGAEFPFAAFGDHICLRCEEELMILTLDSEEYVNGYWT